MMVLADTSVWIGHFRGQEPGLAPLLEEGAVLTHPFILGELACGNLKKRALTLADLNALPVAVHAEHEEALQILDRQKLWGLEIGWIDTHLIASALLSNCLLWTLDERLRKAAAQAGAKILTLREGSAVQ
jgi:predicted nucleic acid-binding protein